MSNQSAEATERHSSRHDEKIRWLTLPVRDFSKQINGPLLPATARTVRQYCGIEKESVYTFADLVWTQHWFPKYLLEVPGFTSGLGKQNPKNIVLAGREKDLLCLKGNGFTATTAIGFPACYTNERTMSRRARSLLLIPGNLFGTASCSSSITAYLSQIKNVRGNFADVVACLRPEFIRRTDWVDQLNDAGIPFVSGFDERDCNSWQRLRELYLQFEYVTTNALNAELIYATAVGTKSSIFGPSEIISLEDVSDVQMFVDTPGLAERVLPLLQEESIKTHMEFLYGPPQKSIQRTGWGLAEIGWEHRRTRDELLRLIFKKKPHRLGHRIRARISSTATAIGQRLQQHETTSANSMIGRLNADDAAELRRLEVSTADQPGSAVIDGEKFYFADARTFAWEYTQIYLKQCYDFPSIYESPIIIDGGANIGIAVRYWLKQFPKAKILAFEPDSKLFAILEKNVERYLPGQVDLYNVALWKADETLLFCSTGIETGHLKETQQARTDGTKFSVNAVRLSSFLDQSIEFLKLDIEGAEVDVLVEARRKLKNVKRIWLEYHSLVSRPQRLGELLEIFREEGFRFHIVTETAFTRPLRYLEATYGMDQRLNIWATRGDQFPRMVEPDVESSVTNFASEYL